MVLELSREEVLKVCNDCASYNPLKDTCEKDRNSPKLLRLLRRCQKWEEYYGDKCFFRG